ncbi:MAG: hypothetical protein HQ562_05285 [Candidatus Marinimicrobia bacterium]|nr:hypothetical protein [Candidatus Neomarinimicrobiota bacterium]
MSPNKKLRVYISDQPDSELINEELITKTRRDKFHRDLSKLVKERQAGYHGRAWNKNTGFVYQVFTVEGKQICVEDPDATQVLHSLFDKEGELREVDIK